MNPKKKTPNIALIALSILFTLIFLLICNPSQASRGYAPRSLMVLTTEPMPGILMAYPSIQQLYESDYQIVIVTHWGHVRKPGNYDFRIEIYDAKEEKIYTSENQSVSIRSNMFVHHTIPIVLIKDSLTGGGIYKLGTYTVKLYVNDKLTKTQTGQYIDESIRNSNVKSAVVLPFIIRKHKISISSDVLSSSFAHAIYCEVKRIILNTTPHNVAKGRIEKTSDIKCFIDESCTESIIDRLNKDVVIAGSVEIGAYVGEINRLQLYVYNTKSGVMKKFQTSVVATRQSVQEVCCGLVRGILFEEGFFDYLRHMSYEETVEVAARAPQPAEIEKVRIGVLTNLERKYLEHLRERLGKRPDCQLLELLDPISHDRLDVDVATTLRQKYQIDMMVSVNYMVGSGVISRTFFTKLIDVSHQRMVKLKLGPVLVREWEKELVRAQIEPIEKMIKDIYREKRKGKL